MAASAAVAAPARFEGVRRAGISILFAPISVDADFSRFENEGSNPLDLDRFRVRLVWDFLARTGIAAEWSHDQYDETLFPTAGYEATRYGIYLRYRQ